MLLAIDTSTEWIGLGLHDGVRVISEVTWHSQNYHTVELVPSIAAMLERTHTPRSALSGLAVALGPGSFTGLRIGLSAVKGLALGLSLPAVGIPSLEMLAASRGFGRAQAVRHHRPVPRCAARAPGTDRPEQLLPGIGAAARGRGGRTEGDCRHHYFASLCRR